MFFALLGSFLSAAILLSSLVFLPLGLVYVAFFVALLIWSRKLETFGLTAQLMVFLFAWLPLALLTIMIASLLASALI